MMRQEEDEGPIHGFLDNRTVFVQQQTVRERQSNQAHLSFLRGVLVDSLKHLGFCDFTLLLSDGKLLLSRLVSLLGPPVLVVKSRKTDYFVITDIWCICIKMIKTRRL